MVLFSKPKTEEQREAWVNFAEAFWPFAVALSITAILAKWITWVPFFVVCAIIWMKMK